MTDELPAFALYEEHEALREAVRALADDKIAPRAAEIDRTSEFPWDVYEELFGAPEHKLGIKGSPTRELYFDDCEIPASRLIGAEGEGFKTALRTLDHTRITIAAQALGIAQGALDYALGYLKERKQFGRAIADFQGLQFMVADMAMKLEAARQLTYAAAAKSTGRWPASMSLT